MVYLIGNRADLGDTDAREVTVEDGQQLMEELRGDHFMEVSAMTGQGIGELFCLMTKHLYLENYNRLAEFR